MLPKGKRRQSVKADYRAARDVVNEVEAAELKIAEAQLYGEDIAPIKATIPNTAVPDRPKRAGKGGFQKSGRRQIGNLEAAPALPPSEMDEDDELVLPEPAAMPLGARKEWVADHDARGYRVDQYLTKVLPDISRARAQLLIDHGQVRVNDIVVKSKQKMHGGERVVVEGDPQPTPLKATAEDIPLSIVFEDRHMAVIDKPAGMMVHAGSGLTDDARSSGTLVNALLFHFKDQLSDVGGPLRPGIVHRLDKQTSGLIMVAKSDIAHRALAEKFSERTLEKRYLALVHRHVKSDRGLIDLPIARDRVRRTRMTTRVANIYMTTASHGSPSLRHPDEPEPETRRRANHPRPARTHYTVLERLHTTAGDFTLLDVKIETGRTHQIRVHMQALGHPVVGDTLYGAPGRIAGMAPKNVDGKEGPTLGRNFLHAARLLLDHPITAKPLDLTAPLPTELAGLLEQLRKLEIAAITTKSTDREDW
jgi:23S rRNA pseudouridine1911/1915/1917 synthase